MKILLFLLMLWYIPLLADEFQDKALEILVRTTDKALALQMPNGRLIRSPEDAKKQPEDYIYFLTRLKAGYIRGQYNIPTFAVLYTYKSEKNPYYMNKKLLDALEKALVFFDKYMDYDFHQHRICNYLGFAYTVLEKHLNKNQKKKFKDIFRKWGTEIARRVESAKPHTGRYTTWDVGVNTNHFAIYNMAILRLGKILKKKKWVETGTRQLKNIIKIQHPDGYWDEWNGPAVGYNYVTSQTVMEYYEVTGDKAALEALEKSLKFHIYFSYPNMCKIETPDGRTQMGYGPTLDAHGGFSHFPEGRRFALKHLNEWIRLHPEKIAWGESGTILALNMLAWKPGESKPLPTEYGDYVYRLKLPAGVRRQGPWIASYSAITFKEWPDDQFFLKRQVHFSVWHDSAGLILVGPNTRGHNRGGTFHMNRNLDQSVGTPLSGTLSQGSRTDVLTAKYDGFSSELTLTATNNETFIITGKVREHNDPPALIGPDFEMHLLLNLHIGDTVETEGSGKIVLTDQYTDYPPKKVGKWIRKGKWTLRIPKNSRFIFPYALFNSYCLFGYPPYNSQKVGMILCTFPTKDDMIKCRLIVKK